MRAAWERGIVLAGLSAGAMCWFEGGITMSGGCAAPPPTGSGCSAAACRSTWTASPSGCRCSAQAIATGRLPAGFAADDGAALLFAGPSSSGASPRAPAPACCGQADGDGGTVERELPVTPLAGALPAPGTTPMRERRVGAGR